MRTSKPSDVQIFRRLGATKINTHPSAIPPIPLPKRPTLLAVVVEGATVFTVSVAVTTEELVIDAVAGTAQVGAFVVEEPPVTAQLSCTDPVKPPAG